MCQFFCLFYSAYRTSLYYNYINIHVVIIIRISGNTACHVLYIDGHDDRPISCNCTSGQINELEIPKGVDNSHPLCLGWYDSYMLLNHRSYMEIGDLTQSYDKNHYANRKFENQWTTQKRHQKLRLQNDCGST